MGIEPTWLAWKASVLPLNYTRRTHINTMLKSADNLYTTFSLFCKVKILFSQETRFC